MRQGLILWIKGEQLTFNDLHLATRFFREMVVIFTLEMSNSDNSSQCLPGREKINEPCQEKTYSVFPTRSHTSRAVQPQKMVRALKLPIWAEEGLYFLCSENKGAYQLHGYCVYAKSRIS